MQVLDFSDRPPGAAAIRRAGFVGVARYLAPLPNPKVLTRAEVDDCLANGLGIAAVFESSAGRSLGGRSAGELDASTAVRELAALGAPAGVMPYFAVDFPATAAQLAAVEAYADGAGHVCHDEGYRRGLYGDYLVTAHALQGGHADGAWQTAAWSGGAHLRTARLYQRAQQVVVNGTTCDVNDVLAADWGQWPTPPPDGPTPAPTLEEPMLCTPSWSKRHPDATFPCYAAFPTSTGARVNAYNGAPLIREDGRAYGIVPYIDVPGDPHALLGVTEVEDTGAIVVVFSDGHPYDVARRPA